MKAHFTVTRSIRCGILAASILGFTAIASHAAVVTWGAATNISGNSDVSTAGTFVGALNFGGSTVANTTVNGVTFTGLNLTGATNVTSGIFTFTSATPASASDAVGSANAPFSSLSAPYRALLSSRVSSFGTFTLSMSGLATGATYQFEWWSNDSTGPISGPTTATAGNSVAIARNTNIGAPGGIGQFALGTFVADATGTQAIDFGTQGPSNVNGVQLRQFAPATAVPEPGSALAGLLALGACASGLVRRNRHGAARA